jgi:hypothetical protein
VSTGILGPMLRRGASIWGAIAACLVATRADASPSARLVYVRDATASACPDEDGLRQAVKRRIGYEPFFPWAKTTVIVELTGDGSSFVAHVRLVDESSRSQGVRELRSGANGCPGLIDAAALAISIALDMSGSEVAAPSPAPPGPAPPATESPAPAPAAPAPAPPAPADGEVVDRDSTRSAAAPSILWAVGFDALTAIEAAPSVVPGIDLWTAARLGIGSLGVDVRGDATSTKEGASGGQARVVLLAATVAPCAHAGPLFACALGTVDWLHASGAGVQAPQSNHAWVPAVGPRAGFDVPLGRSFALRVRGDLLVNLVLPTVTLNGPPVWTLAQFSGIVAVGLAYRFP